MAANVNTDGLGNLGLTDEEEDALVAFMMAMSDGYWKTDDLDHKGKGKDRDKEPLRTGAALAK